MRVTLPGPAGTGHGAHVSPLQEAFCAPGATGRVRAGGHGTSSPGDRLRRHAAPCSGRVDPAGHPEIRGGVSPCRVACPRSTPADMLFRRREGPSPRLCRVMLLALWKSGRPRKCRGPQPPTSCPAQSDGGGSPSPGLRGVFSADSVGLRPWGRGRGPTPPRRLRTRVPRALGVM